MNPAVAFSVRNLKKELVSHGGTGYHALQRRFRIMDDDNSKTINYAEFKKGMTELGIKNLANSEMRQLFAHFGKCHFILTPEVLNRSTEQRVIVIKSYFHCAPHLPIETEFNQLLLNRSK